MGAACSAWRASAGAMTAVRCRADCHAVPLRLLVPCSAACLEPPRAWFPACAATWLRQLAGRDCLETAVRRSSAHSLGRGAGAGAWSPSRCWLHDVLPARRGEHGHEPSRFRPRPARRAHGRAGPFGARHTQSRGLEAKPAAGMRGLPSP